jgi:hypothetical protein
MLTHAWKTPSLLSFFVTNIPSMYHSFQLIVLPLNQIYVVEANYWTVGLSDETPIKPCKNHQSLKE